MISVNLEEIKRVIFSLESANEEYRNVFDYASNMEAYRGIDKLASYIRQGGKLKYSDVQLVLELAPHMVNLE